jgi:hypothetical protein
MGGNFEITARDCDFLPPTSQLSLRSVSEAMDSETAELAIVDAAHEPAPPPARAASAPARALPGAGRLARLRADSARMSAVRESWRALWTSRLLVWTAGVAAVATLGFGPHRNAFDPPGTTRGFGWLGDLLAAPAARWDSDWFLVIARYGYRPDLAPLTNARTAYFPLYPLGIRAIGALGAPLVLAGVLLSLFAFALALYGIHRLTTLELARGGRLAAGGRRAEIARLAVIVTAFSPMAFFFSAVYSESLFLALSVGLFWSARNGRWVWVGILGALAGATRSTGLMLALPAVVIYLYGPREDRPPDRDGSARAGAGAARAQAATHAAAGARSLASRLARALVPRYRLRPDVVWLALLPAGVVIYAAWLGLSGGDALGPFHAENAWSRQLVGPFAGLWDGVTAAFDGARQLLSFQTRHVYFKLAGGSPYVAAEHNLVELAFLAAAVPAVIGVLRRLPLAYGLYAIAAIALPLSYPVKPEPLMSIPRYLVVLFPLSIWLAAWLSERPRLQRPALACSIVAMIVFLTQFSTWHWVA